MSAYIFNSISKNDMWYHTRVCMYVGQGKIQCMTKNKVRRKNKSIVCPFFQNNIYI